MKINKRMPPALVLAGALAIAGCSGGSDTGGATSGEHHPGAGATASPAPNGRTPAHNQADVTFAHGMIPHHRQALEMSALATERAKDAKVKRLVRQIERAQDPEITTMSGWLTSWGEQVPGESAGGEHGGHGGSGMGEMSGMMSEADMKALRGADGSAFDRLFLEQMIEHHRGAVTMAKTQIRDGSHGPAIALAKAVVKSQTAEIVSMGRMLRR